MKKIVQVIQNVEVELDETKFDERFLAAYREDFYDFHRIDDHFMHIGQLAARGIADSFSSFIEGYGPPEDFGIKTTVLDRETEVEIL